MCRFNGFAFGSGSANVKRWSARFRPPVFFVFTYEALLIGRSGAYCSIVCQTG